jgi:hypothetical protein
MAKTPKRKDRTITPIVLGSFWSVGGVWELLGALVALGALGALGVWEPLAFGSFGSFWELCRRSGAFGCFWELLGVFHRFLECFQLPTAPKSSQKLPKLPNVPVYGTFGDQSDLSR